MELTPRLQLMNWLVSQGLTGLPENDLLRGFCQRCRAEGLDLSRGLLFIDTLHPIFEGRGVRWNDAETNESEAFEYGSTSSGDAAQSWRRTMFHHLLEHGHDEIRIDLAECDKFDFSMIDEIAAKGHKHFVAFCASLRRGRHRWGRWIASDSDLDDAAGRRSLAEQQLAALRDLVPALGLAPTSPTRHADIARTLGRVISAATPPSRCCAEKFRGGVTEQIKAAPWFSDARWLHRDQREPFARRHTIPFLNDYAQGLRSTPSTMPAARRSS